MGSDAMTYFLKPYVCNDASHLACLRTHCMQTCMQQREVRTLLLRVHPKPYVRMHGATPWALHMQCDFPLGRRRRDQLNTCTHLCRRKDSSPSYYGTIHFAKQGVFPAFSVRFRMPQYEAFPEWSRGVGLEKEFDRCVDPIATALGTIYSSLTPPPPSNTLLYSVLIRL